MLAPLDNVGNKEISMITIEKDIEMPVEETNWSAAIRETLRKMEVGNSFRCKLNSRGYVSKEAKVIGIKVITRKVQGLIDVIRVWRVE